MISIGVIGCGTISQLIHLPILAQMADVRVDIVSDISEYRLGMAQRRFGVESATTSAADLLAAPGLDAVVIATEDVSHFDLVMMALRNGKHVFVEKPLCVLPEHADAIIACARTAGLVVAVGFQKLYDRSLAWLAEMQVANEETFLVSVRDICHDNDMVISAVAPEEMRSQEFLDGRSDYTDSGVWRSVVEGWYPNCPRDLADTYRVFLNLACHDLSVVVGLCGEPTAVAYAEFSEDDTRRGLVIYEVGRSCRCVLEIGLTMRSWFDQSVRIYSPSSTAVIEWPSPFRLEAQSSAMVTRMAGPNVETRSYQADGGIAFRNELASFVRAVSGEDDAPRGSMEHARTVLQWQVNAIRADVERRMRIADAGGG